MIYLDDKPLTDYGLYLLKGHSHPSPNIENKTVKIPGRAGLWKVKSEINERPFNYPVGIYENKQMESQSLLNKFMELLFDEYGQPRKIKVVFGYDPDKYYYAEFDGSIDPERIYETTQFELPLTAFDPYKYASMNQYDPDEDVIYGEVGDNDYYDNPRSFNWIYAKHYSGINNYSFLNTDLMIDIRGTVSNPKITNLNNNQTLTLPSITDGRLVIDGKQFVIIRDSQEILEGSNYNFFNIQPGEVGFLFEGDNPNATVTYKWLHKFM